MDADSPMTDSPGESPSSSALLSPPGSQAVDKPTSAPRNMPVISPSANANGKRPLNDISNGADSEISNVEQPVRTGIAPGEETTENGSGSVNGNGLAKEHVHESGYRWSRPEDEPGYAWNNKKAIDEYNRSIDVIMHKDIMIRDRYGDPFEMVEREAARNATS